MSLYIKWCLHFLDFTDGRLGLRVSRSPLTIPLIQNPEADTTRYSNPDRTPRNRSPANTLS
ncbi:hypothetical protein QUA00_29745 [Microcoleus sp. T2B6]|uniref:hypothetical protein n=1 Tax=Microcoleus sp. T2B6 TaxID=3055424 RepID=UPI002FD1B4CB